MNRSVSGTIVSARQVTINTNTGISGTVGGVAGAIAGSGVGGSARANALGAIGGAVVGALVGSTIEQKSANQQGMEYVVSTSNGALMTVVMLDSEPQFQQNDKVLILYGSPARIIKNPRP